MNKKKGKIIEEFVNCIFVIASILLAFFAGVLIENTVLSLILLMIATICGLIKLSYNDEEDEEP